ncbi:hypothetical protein GTPT_1896 [Tatumella ptyseos ATCC 33301]|uniref:Uncharacterized protein n=1 Tax=Tatumella ptyseos ATCC 33301 TaxID=1005995 RepID=A0A085JF65_9GAMM|nr:hypothetical protein GTPT_1896 [Tatumella ptyseos ATCC 33301]
MSSDGKDPAPVACVRARPVGGYRMKVAGPLPAVKPVVSAGLALVIRGPARVTKCRS